MVSFYIDRLGATLCALVSGTSILLLFCFCLPQYIYARQTRPVPAAFFSVARSIAAANLGSSCPGAGCMLMLDRTNSFKKWQAAEAHPPSRWFLLQSWQVLVAAFAISGYSSTYYRAGSKPFNPVLGETYECIREDKGFCFFSEQVGLRWHSNSVFSSQIWTIYKELITLFNFDYRNRWLDSSSLLTQTQCSQLICSHPSYQQVFFYQRL